MTDQQQIISMFNFPNQVRTAFEPTKWPILDITSGNSDDGDRKAPDDKAKAADDKAKAADDKAKETDDKATKAADEKPKVSSHQFCN